MSIVASLQPVAKWRVSAESDGAQGADGVSQLAKTAFRNLLDADWEYDHDEPTLPVHEYDRARPYGQAYKAVWGYNADERTERSCCGAACYTYRIPDDAFDETNVDGVALLSQVAVQIQVDRYCDKGAIVYCELSHSSSPTKLNAIMGVTIEAQSWFATNEQTSDSGNEIPPNKRSGASGEATYNLNSQAPQEYLHVYLLLADYESVRGAWIEGGAIFTSDSVNVEFSRTITFADDSVSVALTNMDVGRIDFTDSVTPVVAINSIPRASCWINWLITPVAATYFARTDKGWNSTVNYLLSHILNNPSLYDGQEDKHQIGGSINLSGNGTTTVSDLPSFGFASMVCHGLTYNKTFRGLKLEKPINPSSGGTIIPYRLNAYGIKTLPTFKNNLCATPIPWWGDVISEEYRKGEKTSLKCLSDPTSAMTPTNGISDVTQSSAQTTEVPVTPLASVDVADADIDTIPFDQPWQSGEISSIVLSLTPNSVPTSIATTENVYDATLSRSVKVLLTGSGASKVNKTERGDVSERTTDTMYYTPHWFSATFELTKLLVNAGAIPSAKVNSSVNGGYDWVRTGKWASIPTAKNRSIIGDATFTSSVRIFIPSFQFYHEEKLYLVDADVWFDAGSHVFESVCSVYGAYEVSSGHTFPLIRDFSMWSNDIVKASFTAVCGDDPSKTLDVEIHPYLSFDQNGEFLYSDLVYDNLVSVVYDKWRSTHTDTVYIHGYNDYNWVDTTDSTDVATLTTDGTVSFVRDGITYSATLPQHTSQESVLVKSKDETATAIDGKTLDRYASAQVSGTLPAQITTLDFMGEDGSTIRGQLTIPAQAFDSSSTDWGGILYVKTINVYRRLGEKIATRTAHDDGQQVSINETAAEQTIDLGMVSLYE